MRLSLLLLPDRAEKDVLTVTGISVGVNPEENIVMKAVSETKGKIFLPMAKDSSS